MMDSALLPILLLLFFGFLVFLVKGLRPRLNRLITWRNNLLFAGAYLVLLLLLVLVSTFLLKGGFLQSSEGADLITKSPQDWADIDRNHFPPKVNLDQYPEIYKNSSQTFKLNSNTLTFEDSSSTGYNLLIERKSTNDGEIEVSTYVSPHYAGGFDFTKKVLPPMISLENGGRMSFQAPTSQNLEFIRFNPVFTVNQFKQVNQNHPSEMYSSRFGWKAIYLRVPKNLEIIDSGGYNVQMVN